MDKNKIKAFAIWARRKLIEQVSEKANSIGIYEDKIEKVKRVQGGFIVEGKEDIIPISIEIREALEKQIKEKGYEQVMEEVAYTWFNRFMGLRYMEVNDYLPSGLRILSSEDKEKKEPDVLTKVSEIIEELELNSNEIYDLLDTGNTLDREKAYRIILVKQCNELGKIIPQMFEKITDYTELLLPDNLLEEGSVVRKMVEDIEEEDWKEEVEIIGWMYQYYISEKKDEVFAALKKNVKITKENIPAATQLFTPKWIVKYMVENSLGRLWLEKLSVDSGQWAEVSEELKKKWKYYLEEAEQEPEVEEELKKIREEHAKLNPEDIKVLDPCMGSGHILVYAFDVLYEIYKTAGYSEREIPKLILQNNLYGLDIDDRAAQLASFALIMKARHYNRRLFREIEKSHIELNLCSIQESNGITEEMVDYFCSEQLAVGSGQSLVSSEQLREDVQYLIKTFTDAKEYGSILEVEKVNFEEIKERLKEIKEDNNLMFGDYRKILLEKLPTLIKQGMVMSDKYETCVTNPPYMGLANVNNNLNKYVKKHLINGSSDLYAAFMLRGIKYIKQNYKLGVVVQQSWMFVSSYEKMRIELMNNMVDSLIHLGSRAFEDISGEVVQTATLVMTKFKDEKYITKFIKLDDFKNSKEKEKMFFDEKKCYYKSINKLKSIPKSPLAYWISENMLKGFKKGVNIGDRIPSLISGNKTANNEKYIRFNWEVNSDEINKKWCIYAKGGQYRKWYGNIDTIIDWSNEAKIFYKDNKTSNIIHEKYFFKEGITYTDLTSKNFNGRILDNNMLFDMSGPGLLIENIVLRYYIMALLNSEVGATILNMLNSSFHVKLNDIARVPFVEGTEEKKEIIKNIVQDNLKLSQNDWDSFGNSWGFKIHPLLKGIEKGENYKIESIFNVWEAECEENFEQLKTNEEELNRIFIDIYGLQDELTPEVEDKDVTIRKADRERDIKSFISYAVGCMFGRYSIDAEGLIYAGGEWSDKWSVGDSSQLAVGSEQLEVAEGGLLNTEHCTLQTKVRSIKKDEDGNIISDSWIDSRFTPDKENIIPITEDEYFEDDIVTRFIQFIKTVYGDDTLEENLDFIADSIGRKGTETARQAIRRYFIKDFYKDHLKIYQKRPIYWMFESGKNNGFKCLIYMHRYNEQTVAKVRTDYLHALQRKYEAEIQRQEMIIDSEQYTAKEKATAKKKIDKISKQIEECKEYDGVVAYLANEQIHIDLDDGVKVNYAKFQNVEIINSKDKKVKMNLLAKI